MYRIWKEEMRKIASGKIVWLGLILLPALLYLRLMSQVSTYRVTIDGEYFEGKEALMMDQKLTKEYAGPLTEEKVRQIYRDFGFCYWSQENGAVGNFCNKFITEEMTDFNEKGWENQDAISFYSGEDWENYVAPMLTGDIWFDYVDGWRDLREIYGIIVIIGLLLIFMVAVAPVFAEGYTLRTTDLVLTTKEGKKGAVRMKIAAAFSFTVLVYCVITLFVWGIYLEVYGLQGLDASARLLGVPSMGYCPGTVSGFFIYQFFLGLAGVLLLTAITLAVSAVSRSSFAAVVISLVLFFVPYAWITAFRLMMPMQGIQITWTISHFMMSMPYYLALNWGFAFAGKQILMHMATAAVVGTAAGMAGYYKYINYQGR